MSPRPRADRPRRPRREAWRAVGNTFAAVLAVLVVVPAAVRADATPGTDAPLIHLSRADAWYGLAAVAAVGGIGLADDWFRERALASDGDGSRRLGRAVRPLGAPL